MIISIGNIYKRQNMSGGTLQYDYTHAYHMDRHCRQHARMQKFAKLEAPATSGCRERARIVRTEHSTCGSRHKTPADPLRQPSNRSCPIASRRRLRTAYGGVVRRGSGQSSAGGAEASRRSFWAIERWWLDGTPVGYFSSASWKVDPPLIGGNPPRHGRPPSST